MCFYNVQLTPGARGVKDKGLSVVIDLNGLGLDDIRQKTKAIRKHGSNPFWNEVFTFTLQDPSDGQITLRVFSNNVCTGFVSVPLSHLRTGFRNLQLFEETEANDFIAAPMEMSSLFVRVRRDTLNDFNAHKAQTPVANAKPENLKLMKALKDVEVPEVSRRHSDGSMDRNSSRPSEKHWPLSSMEAGGAHAPSIQRSSTRDSSARNNRSSSRSDRDRDKHRHKSSSRHRDDDYRRSSSRDDRHLERRHSSEHHASSSRGDRQLERRHSSEHRSSSSRGDRHLERRHSSEHRSSSSRGDRHLERRHSSEHRASSSRDDRQLERRHSSEHRSSSSRSDRHLERRHSSEHRSRSSRDKYGSEGSGRSSRDADAGHFSRSSGDVRREGDRESRRHRSSTEVTDRSRHHGRQSNRDKVLRTLPSLEEHDAEHQPTDDDDDRKDVVNTAPPVLMHGELKNNPDNTSLKQGGEKRFDVDRGDDDLPQDPWTPPV